MIRPYLRDMINDHKTPMKVHLPNKVTDYETAFGNWKIQKKMRLIVFLLKQYRNFDGW